MFKKNPIKKLRKVLDAKLEEARNAQRAGDIQRVAELTAEADALGRQLDALEASEASG